MPELTIIESSELAQHESTIQRGLNTFVEVGAALLAIRDGKLYRAEFGTFEEYCQERWGITPQQGHRLMAASVTVKELEPIGSILPATESQARPLTQLEPEQKREVWALAVDTAPNGKVTAAHVQSVVDEYIAPEKQAPHVSHNSGNNEWYTPVEFIASALAVMGTIDLDPASSAIANQIVGARKFYSVEDSGLDHKWRGRVWMNPPYASDLIGQFTHKFAAHVEAGDITEGVVLVNNATETAWFYELVSVAQAVCFTRSRVKYLNEALEPRGAPLQGQALIYCGPNPQRFVKEYVDLCWGVVL